MVYLAIFLLLVAGIYSFDFRKRSAGELAYFGLMCFFFIAVAGLRYRIGNDTIIYENNYEQIPTLLELGNYRFSKMRFEPGFVVFSSITRTFSPDFVYFQIFHAIVVNVIVFWFVYNNTQNKFIALLLYFICLYLNLNTEVMREALAVCCLLVAWPFFRKSKWLLYYPLAILACTFHVSAFILLFLPVLTLPGVRYFFKLGPQTVILALIIFAVTMIVQRKFFFILEHISSNETVAERAAEYSKNSLGGLKLNVFGMTEHLVKFVFIPVGALIYLKRRVKIENDITTDQRWLKRIEIIIVGGLYFAIVALAIPIAARINNYVGMFNYVAVSSCFFTVAKLRRGKFRLPPAYWAVILLLVCSVYFKLYFVNTHGSATKKVYMVYYPYESQLDPKENYDREVIFRLFKHFK